MVTGENEEKRMFYDCTKPYTQTKEGDLVAEGDLFVSEIDMCCL
jgi:hypothetical protein